MRVPLPELSSLFDPLSRQPPAWHRQRPPAHGSASLATIPIRLNGRLMAERSQLSSSIRRLDAIATGIDRPAGMLRELHDAEPGDACNFWNIGGHRNIVALFEGRKHFV